MSNSESTPMDAIYELVNHLAHQVAMKDEKLSMISGKERREYMERMSEGRESVMRLIEFVSEEAFEAGDLRGTNHGLTFEQWYREYFLADISQQLTEKE